MAFTNWMEMSLKLFCLETSNINQFCEFKWFEWVMFQDEIAPYPNDHFRLDRYLGPSIDIGSVLMAKIIKESVESFIVPCIKQ